jgi:hypothetical protein
MSSDRLECDDCGTLNVVTAKFCSLCNKSLVVEDNRRREGDPRVMIGVAIASTVLFVFALLSVIVWAMNLGSYSAHPLRGTLLAGAVLFFLGTLTVGFWRGAKRALDARKR